MEALNPPAAPELYPDIPVTLVCELLEWVVAELASAYALLADLKRREIKDYRLLRWITALESAQDQHWEWYAARKAG